MAYRRLVMHGMEFWLFTRHPMMTQVRHTCSVRDVRALLKS